MKITLLSPASPELSKLAEITRPSKEEYAHHHRIRAEFPVYHGASSDHGFGRISFMDGYIRDCDWLVFMGADTMFTNMTIDMRSFCDPSYDLIAAWDGMGLQSDVMLLRNSDKMQMFLWQVLEMKHETIQREGFMQSSDQGALVRLLSGHREYNPHARVIPVEECQVYGLRVRQAPQSLNSYLNTFRLGDIIFHAPGMPLDSKIRQMEIMRKQILR